MWNSKQICSVGYYLGKIFSLEFYLENHWLVLNELFVDDDLE